LTGTEIQIYYLFDCGACVKSVLTCYVSTYFSTEIIKIKVTSNHQPLNKYKDQNSTELRIPLWPFEDKFFCFIQSNYNLLFIIRIKKFIKKL